MENTMTETKVEETVTENAESAETGTKSYTDKEIQSMIDARVTQAVQTVTTKLNAERTEAERLAGLSAEERLAEREAIIAEKEKQIAMMENKAEASRQLEAMGLSISLVDLVMADSAEEMKGRMETLNKEIQSAVQKEVEKRLAGTTPTKSATRGGITREEFSKMSLAEQGNLYNSDPALYKTLTN